MKGDLHPKRLGLTVVALLILLFVGFVLIRERGHEFEPIGSTMPTPAPHTLDLGLGDSEDVMADIPPLEEVTDEQREEEAKQLAGEVYTLHHVWKYKGRSELGKAFDEMDKGNWWKARKHLNEALRLFELLEAEDIKEEKRIALKMKKHLYTNMLKDLTPLDEIKEAWESIK